MKDNNLILLPWYISSVNSFDFRIDWMYVFNKPVLQNTCIDKHPYIPFSSHLNYLIILILCVQWSEFTCVKLEWFYK